jgi:ribosomal protein S18 acetylase RimI-like enzyme
MAAKGLAIVPLAKGAGAPARLVYRYRTPGHYALRLEPRARSFRATLRYRAFPRPIAKAFTSDLFAPHVPEARAFAARLLGEDVGWIEVGYERWNRRLRVWELLVDAAHRGHGVGAALMGKATEVARRLGARMIVLETQSCNVPAIGFYRALGFEIIGFDASCYRDDDVARGEVRLEMGLSLVGRGAKARRSASAAPRGR